MSDKILEILSDSVERTIEIGKELGRGFKGGEVVCLEGALGSGKTHLVKGIAAGVGVDDYNSVNSPTFVLVNEYYGRLDVYHIDAYRIESISEFEMLGFNDFIGPGSVVLVEWADKVARAMDGVDCIKIEMQHAGQSKRLIRVTSC